MTAPLVDLLAATGDGINQEIPFTAATLPQFVAAENFGVRVESDPLTGARITGVHDTEAGPRIFATANADAAAKPDWNGSTWRIKGTLRRPVGASEPFSVDASDASFFSSYAVAADSDGVSALMLEWRGIFIPGAPTERLWVRVALVTKPGNDWVDATGWCGHETGNDSRIEEFQPVRLAVLSPASSRGGESNAVASWRSRILLPFNIHNTGPSLVANSSLGYNAVFGNLQASDNDGYPSDHPASRWPLGFASLVSGNNSDAANYLQTLHIQCRDRNGWLKRFWTQTRNTNGGTDTTIMMAPTHIVGFELAQARGPIEPGLKGPLMPESHWRNSYVPRWSLEIHKWQGDEPRFWFDCCVRYRDMYQRTKQPIPLIDNDLVGPFRKAGGLMLATISFRKETEDDGRLDAVEHYAKLYRDGLDSPEVPLSSDNMLAEYQTWTNKGGDVDHSERDFSDVIQGFREHALRMRDMGFRVILYTRLNNDRNERGFSRDLGDEFIALSDKDGNLIFAGVEGIRWEKYADSFPDAAIRLVQLPIVTRYRCGGTYSDSYSGGNTVSGTARGEGAPRAVVAHGGRYYTDHKITFVEVSREIWGQFSSFLDGNETDEGFVVFSEIIEEGGFEVCMPFDWMGRGYEFHPVHLDQAEDAALALLFGGAAPPQATDYPVEAREQTPPLWQCVHNRWNPTGSFTITPDLSALEGTDFQPPGFGLTPVQWLENNCLAFALQHSTGVHQILFSHQIDTPQPLGVFDSSGSIVADPVRDPTGVGIQALAFYRELLRVTAPLCGAPYLIDGVMQRPFRIDYGNANLASRPNPAQHYAGVAAYGEVGQHDVQENWFIYSQTGNQATWLGNEDFPVTDVLHSVWEARDGSIGLMLINWTGDEGAWEAELVLSQYEAFAGATSILWELVAPDGSASSIGSSTGATQTIATGSGAGAFRLGVMPARTVWMLRLTSS